jgi:hypothetical protein
MNNQRHLPTLKHYLKKEKKIFMPGVLALSIFIKMANKKPAE